MAKKTSDAPITEYARAILNHLIPYPENAKIHDDEQVNRLAAHIAECGYDVPIVIDEDNIILKGHCRRLALLKLGRGAHELDIVRRRGLTEAQKKKIRLADNKLGESPWDNALVKQELDALAELGVNLDAIGWDSSAIDALNALLAPPAEPDTGAQLSGLIYKVLVTCNDELQQTELADRLEAEGYKCQILIS